MRQPYVEIIGKVEGPGKLKMHKAMNLGDNIGEFSEQVLFKLLSNFDTRYGSCEPYHRAHAYSPHGSVLGYNALRAFCVLRDCSWPSMFPVSSQLQTVNCLR